MLALHYYYFTREQMNKIILCLCGCCLFNKDNEKKGVMYRYGFYIETKNGLYIEKKKNEIIIIYLVVRTKI